MDYPKISIITPSYNQGNYIEETIQSILDQNYPNLEYIVIDGGSSDNSIEVIKKYENAITFWISEKDNGQSEAINKGLKMATGTIINWINSDDIVTPGTFNKIAEFFNNHDDNVGLIHGGVTMFNNTIDIADDFGYDNPTLERYLSGISFSQPAAYFRKTYLDKVGLLNEDYEYGMDYDLYARLALVCNFLKVNDLFSRYRVHKASKTGSLFHEFIDDWIKIFLNVIYNIDATYVVEEIKKLKVFENYFSDTTKYPFEINIKKVDQPLMLFYFLCYVLKADYKSGSFKRGRTILNYLKKNYNTDDIFKEKDMKVIVKRLNSFPDNFILILRKFVKLAK